MTVVEPSFVNQFSLGDDSLGASDKASRLSNITSMVHIGSIPGALISFFTSGRIGILWTMRQLCMVWIIGVIIVMTSSGRLGQLYAGRLVMGIGIGQSGVIAPTYLAEVAPVHVRGRMVSLFASSEYLGIMIGVSMTLNPFHIPHLT